MRQLNRLPILTWILWFASIAMRFAGFSTLAGSLFVLGGIWFYWSQRAAVQRHRKLIDACAIVGALVSVVTIVSLAIEALFRNS